MPSSKETGTADCEGSCSELAENYNASVNRHLTYDVVKAIVDLIKSRTEIRPKLAIVCGSGLGHLSDVVQDATVIPYEEIPDFPVPSVLGHKGSMLIGRISGKPVLCLSGRFHSYEGHAAALCCLPVKVMKLLGIKLLVTTCAAGGVATFLQKGDVMIIKDHINLPALCGLSPLTGPNDDRFGPRFPPLLNVYQKKYRDLMRSIGSSSGAGNIVKEGVYLCISGPAFETVAESLLFRSWGVGAAGMSVAHEATSAAHCGIDVIGLAIISDMIPDEYDAEHHTTHEEVLQAVAGASVVVQHLVVKFIEKVDV
ncbi:hypothetical protein ACOME3_007086 [Neoechinorhynchus agilis]